jgi:hypothetical protein
MRLVTLLVSVTGLAFAGTWSGYLVDSRCYTSAQNNVSWDSINSRDENMPLRQCAASSQTKRFAIVLKDWSSLKLDAAGNERATTIVHNVPKRSALYCVTVEGTRDKDKIIAGPVHTASIRKLR